MHYTIRTDMTEKELQDFIIRSDKKIHIDSRIGSECKRKGLSLFLGRPSQYGDIICYLPFLTYIEKVFPCSFKIYSLAKKCSQIAPVLFNHSLIDKIEISKEKEGWSDKDIKVAQSCNIIFNINPQLTNQYYYNYRDIIEETFYMNQFWCNNSWLHCAGKNEWDSLTDQEKKPSLVQWFDVDRKPTTIGILPFAGYGISTTKSRNPSESWWTKMISLLKDYKIIHFGHPSNPKLENTINLTHLNLFDTIKEMMGCDIIVGSDSGLQWVMGAYGHPQIVLYTNYQPNHISNYDAFVPVNNKNNLSAFFSLNDINIINQEEVLRKIDEMIK